MPPFSEPMGITYGDHNLETLEWQQTAKLLVKASLQEPKWRSILRWTPKPCSLEGHFLKNRSTEFVPVCIFRMILGPAAGFVAKRERWSRGDRKASKTTKLHKDYWLFRRCYLLTFSRRAEDLHGSRLCFDLWWLDTGNSFHPTNLFPLNDEVGMLFGVGTTVPCLFSVEINVAVMKWFLYSDIYFLVK